MSGKCQYTAALVGRMLLAGAQANQALSLQGLLAGPATRVETQLAKSAPAFDVLQTHMEKVSMQTNFTQTLYSSLGSSALLWRETFDAGISCPNSLAFAVAAEMQIDPGSKAILALTSDLLNENKDKKHPSLERECRIAAVIRHTQQEIIQRALKSESPEVQDEDILTN